MKKTIIKFVMAVLVALFSLNANAVKIEGIYYDLDKETKTAQVSSSNTCTGLVTIPSSIISENEIYSVTSIGHSAFCGCSELTSVSIPSSVTSIGQNAFSGCSGLTSVSIPNSVTSIGSGAFEGCSSLASISIPNSITFIGTNVLEGTLWYNNQPNGLIYAGKIAYKYKGTMPSNTNITIKDGTVSINWYAFSRCSGLTSIVIPNTVTTIGGYAFQGCSNLISITIPDGVTSIGYNAFYNCSSLTSVSIPNSVKTIGTMAFSGCKSLTSLNIPNSVTTIEDYAFAECRSMASVVIPDGVTSIGRNAFHYWTQLTSITIPQSVKSIGIAAFAMCNNLSSVISEVEEPFVFGSDAFYNIAITCTLSVPYGTKDAYIAKGWTEDVFKGGIVEAPYNPVSDNYLTISNAEVCKGRSIVFPVSLSNTKSITALQFEIALPTGVTISKCQLTDRKGEDHSATYKKLTNGNHQVTVISLSKAVFSGTEGALVNLTLDAAENMTADDYDISLTNIELTTADTQAINPADVTATLTVSDVKIADADGNGKVSITDAVAIVSHILGDDIDGFVAAAADVDGNGRITITDAVAVVDMILNGSASAKGRVGMDEEELDPQ